MPTISYDPRFHAVAEEWLEDADLPAALVKRYTPQLAQKLADAAEDFIDSDMVDMEHEREEAARDHHEQGRLDEARGK